MHIAEWVQQRCRINCNFFLGVALAATFLFLCSCTTNSPEIRAQQANQLAHNAGWKARAIYTKSFTLKSFGSESKKQTPIIIIYIEGDGLAWISSDQPSDNPTPMAFTGLKMALNDHSHYPVVYLARPCQLVFNQEWRNCQVADWTNLRFSPEIINSMNQAVNYLKKIYSAKKIILIGYSGGGTIATLLAAKRHDLVKLITVAAVLDTQKWVSQEKLTPLTGSLNPADFWKNLAAVPQIHWVGDKDSVAPKELALAYANRFPATRRPKIIIVPNFSHICCWANLETNLAPKNPFKIL